MRCLTLNSDPRRALRHQDDNLDVQKDVTTLQERRNVLQARLNSWFKIQAVYIPVAQNLRAFQHGDDTRASGHVESDEEELSQSSTKYVAEKVKLYLPSQLPLSLWGTGCMAGLHDIESKLRIAQASDALEQLKQHLSVYSGFVHYKITQVSGPGQKANTCARNLLIRFKRKITRSAD